MQVYIFRFAIFFNIILQLQLVFGMSCLIEDTIRYAEIGSLLHIVKERSTHLNTYKKIMNALWQILMVKIH